MTGRLERALSGGLAYLVAGASARALQLAVLPLIMRAVPPVVFGSYAMIRVALFLFRSLCDLGTSAATVRYGSEGNADREEVFASVWWGRVAIATLLSLVVLASVLAIAPGLATVALLSVAAFFTLGIGDALAAVARASERHTALAMTHVTGALLEAISVVVLVWLWRLGLVGLAASLAIRFTGALIVIALAVLRSALGRPSVARFRSLLRYGVPASVAQLVSTLGAMDRWLIGRISSLANVAAYHLATIPSVLIEILEQAILQAAEPWVYGSSGDQRERALWHLVRTYFVIAIGGALAASLFAPEVLALLAPPEYGAALWAMPWLTFAAVMQGGMRVVGIGSGIAHQTRPWALAGLADLGLAATLIIGLVPRFGVLAAGGARFVAATVGLLVCYVLSVRASEIALPARRFVIVAAIGACASAGVVADSAGHPRPMIWRIGVFVLLGLLTIAVGLAPERARRAAA